MRFHTDAYFQIGQAHINAGKPCQDYATSSWTPDSACAVVSDGCSSGGRTDIGSRVVALTTDRVLRHIGGNLDPQVISNLRVAPMEDAQFAMGLARADLLATCLYAVADQQGALIHVEGDGVIAAKRRDGTVLATKFEWGENTPFYPAYSETDLEAFRKIHAGVALTSTTVIRGPDGAVLATIPDAHALEESMRGITTRLSSEELSETRLIAVFSDGASQIDGVPWDEAVFEFLAMKNFKGDFAKRRMIRGLKDMRSRGKGPMDDVSCAVICVEED